MSDDSPPRRQPPNLGPVTGFRFDHVGLLTSDVDYAAACYRALGCEVTERSRRRGAFDVAYLGAGTDVLVELQGRPLPAESEEYLARQGWSIERVALACDDVAAAHARLLDAGVEEAWAPQPFEIDGTTLAVAAGVWSPEGLMIDLVQLVDAAVPRPVRGGRGGLALHHVCLLTRDLAGAEEFWTRHFGLVKTYDFTAPLDDADSEPDSLGGHRSGAVSGRAGSGRRGFVMLSDRHFDSAGHEFCLEIIGGEHDSIDGPVVERRGPCYDHLCFTADDVTGVWQRAVDLGVEPLSEPAHYPEYGATIAWLYDADGTHIELMSPLDPELMASAHRLGRCENHWVDDWQRSPKVLERRGGRPVQLTRTAGPPDFPAPGP